jgi:hypothetical protein
MHANGKLMLVANIKQILSREWEEKIKQHNSGWFLKKKI